MLPSPLPAAPVRPAVVVNEEIRALVRACGGWLYGESRERYESLVAEWTRAVAAERACGPVDVAA
ncbi:predicted protein [Streptomyces viridosporus ATCC 14672]|uniref:Predicted protein n=1 Tax=Streptomyces viridosporus (strain ATCC 14672 / DSM 40746 / JCM 4963 / KCTC 9882 / NRRL B-12104 / FH 1290) TaxID=566461 RepID=D6A488_STRV1|nr:hypothetical protein [Streptomyces viridosporus]EFE65728.1 predicted protein [Streptomyces viridosporus ATCC 14672]